MYILTEIPKRSISLVVWAASSRVMKLFPQLGICIEVCSAVIIILQLELQGYAIVQVICHYLLIVTAWN
jgi:hypothetical protein